MGYSAEPMNTIYTEAGKIVDAVRNGNSNKDDIFRNLQWSKHPADIVMQIQLEVDRRLKDNI